MNYFLQLLIIVISIIPIITNGKFVNEDNKPFLESIKPLGKIFIILILLFNIFSLWSSINTLQETKDSAKEQARIYNEQIAFLTQLAKTNLIKTDSIRSSVVDNAVKAMEEQRQIIEREKENTFIHLQKEIEENLFTIVFVYKEEAIKNLEDTALFYLNRLSNINMKKYELISGNKKIIDNFMQVSNGIDILNHFSEVLTTEKKSNMRKLDINNFRKCKEDLYGRLTVILTRIVNCKSYKEFEQVNMSSLITIPNRQQLEKFLLIEGNYVSDSISMNKVARLSNMLDSTTNFKK